MTENETLETFLKHEKEKRQAREREVDWEDRKHHWLDAVNALYEQIYVWLQKSIKDQVVEVYYDNMHIGEEYIGDYTTKKMVIRLGPDKIRLEPVGTLIVGSNGRIDLIGTKAAITLVLLENDWHMAIKGGRGGMDYLPLTKESFTDALRQII